MNGGTVLLAMCGICDLGSPPQIIIISWDFQLYVDSEYTSDYDKFADAVP